MNGVIIMLDYKAHST